MQKQTYKQDEAEQILRDAVRKVAEAEAAQATGTADISHERLVAMADELGITPEALDAVLNARAAEQAKVQEQALIEQQRQEFILKRRADFYPHLWSYAAVNLMLIVINLLTMSNGHGRHDNEFWAIYPMLGWGIGIFMHAMGSLPTRGAHFEKEFAMWREKRRKDAERKAARERKKAQGPGGVTVTISPEVGETVQNIAESVQQAVGDVAKAADSFLKSETWGQIEEIGRQSRRGQRRRDRKNDD